MTVITMLSFTNAKLIMLLRDPNFFNVPEERIGRTTNDLIFNAQIVSVFYLAFVGYFYDLLGRKVTIISNLLMAAVCILLIPYTSPSIYPWLFVVRAGIIAGVQGPVANPLVTDYVKKKSRGRATAAQGMGFIAGELLAFAFLFPITSEMTYHNQFLTCSLLCTCTIFFFFFTVKEPEIKRRADQKLIKRSEIEQHLLAMSQSEEEDQYTKLSKVQKVIYLSKECLQACKDNIALPICIVGASITRLVTILANTFFLLWITRGISTGYVKDNKEAEQIYATIMLTSVILSMFFFPLIGKLSDSVNPIKMILVSFLLRFLAIGCLIPLEDPA